MLTSVIVLRSSRCSSYADVVRWLLRSRRSSPQEESWLATFELFVSSHRFDRITEIIKHTVNLQTKLVDVWCTMAYDDVLATIKETKKEVCLYLIVMMSIGTHSMLGCGWKSGKF